MLDNGRNETLFVQLRRLVQAATTMHKCDRRSLLALEADIRLLRHELDARCTILTDKIRDAGARTAALSAYARIGSMAPRQPSPRPTIPTE